MLSTVLKHSLWVLFYIMLLLVVIALTAVLGISNYMSCVSALERMNMEGRPLGAFGGVGEVLSLFLPDTTRAHIIAALIACGEALGLFFFFRLVLNIIPDRIRQRSIWKLQGDALEVQGHTMDLARDAITALVLGGVLAFLIHWDFILLRYQACADALNLEDPAQAASAVPDWATFAAEHDHLMITSNICAMVWGYVALTVLVCLSIEKVLMFMDDHFKILVYQFSGGNAAPALATPDPQPQPELYSASEEFAHADAQDTAETLRTETPAPAMQTPDAGAMGPVPVIGRPGVYVDPSAAAAAPEDYFVHPQTRQIFDLDYWMQLQGN